jgi:teichoic acid transport system permease protein
VLQKSLELCAMVVVMCSIVAASGETPTLRWLRIFPAFFLMALFCAGVAFFAARMTIHVRDIAQLIPFITRLIFYVSGIFYAIGARFSGRGTLTHVLQLNPLNVYITLVRDSLIHHDMVKEGINANLHTWGLGGLYGVVLFTAGFIFFWRAEGLYGRD